MITGVGKNLGFAHSVFLLGLALLVIIGFTGWYVRLTSLDNKPTSIIESKPIEPTALKVVAIGDIVCDPGDPHLLVKQLGYCQEVATYELAAQQKPDAVLALGDLQYEDGALEKFKDRYEKSWGQLKSITYPAPGNHEYGTADAVGYFSYFGSRAGESGKGYYSFDLGGWHFIALNSNCKYIGGCGEDSQQLNWLKQDLAANPKSCTAAFWHHPRFTSGTYSTDTISRDLSKSFWEELAGSKTDLVLNGHDHIYERFAPQSPDGQANQDGPRQFTAGTGGKILYKKKSLAANSEAMIDDKFGILVLELYAKAYRWQFVSTDGNTLDSGYQQCVI